MDFKEIQELIKLIGKSNLSEFKMKDGEFQLHIRTDKYQDPNAAPPQIVSMPQPMPAAYAPAAVPAPAPAPAAPAAAPSAPASSADEDASYIAVRSPMVGTFYRSPGPDKEPFVKVGDTIAKGDVVCIVEAMKLFNEIESEVSGKVVKIMTEDASPVEYDQVLFLLDPKG